MSKFEYQVSVHPTEEFKKLVWVCGESGSCKPDELPGGEQENLVELLNGRGAEGWELIQLNFRRETLVAFWKREVER